MYLVAGLGNPGQKYRNTRHNIGFRVINLWGKSMGLQLKGRRFLSRNSRTRIGDKQVILLRPVTFMNRSGEAIRACVDFYHIRTKHVLVLHDDVDLPVGRIRVVRDGSAGGHKGVLSVIQHLRTHDFPRVKIGIGRPRYGEAIEDYVLSPFYSDEKDVIEKMMQIGVRACELFISSGIDLAMNGINSQNYTDKEVKS